MTRAILTATLLAGLAAATAGAAWAQGTAEAIAQRQAGMKANGAAAGEVKKAMDAGGDLSAVAGKAGDIAAFARRVAALFPPGSGAESGTKTRALPAIWQNNADFVAYANALAGDADKLAVALKANDKAAATAAFGAMGAQCAGCHRAYRAPQ